MLPLQNERTLVFDLLEVHQHRTRSGTAVYAFQGEMDISNASQAYDALLSDWSVDATDITYDLSKLEFLDSSGMRALIRLQGEAIKRNATMRVSIGDNRRMLRLIKLCGLDRVFTVLSSVVA